MPIAFIVLTSLLLFVLPGLLLAVPLRRRGYPPLLSLGLFVAAWVVVFSNLAAVAGYRFGVFAALQAAITASLGVWAWRDREAARDLWGAARRVPNWQWLFYGALALFFLAPAFVLHIPLDTDAQGFGYLALTVRASGSITTLAPFHPEISYLYSPAYFLIIAFLSDLTSLPIPLVMLGFSHLAAVGVVGAAFELGREAGDEALGHLTALGTALGLGLFTTLMDSAYTNVFGIGLTAVFLTMMFRAYRLSPTTDGRPATADDGSELAIRHSPSAIRHPPSAIRHLQSAVCLASLPLAHPDSIIHLLLAYLPFYATMWLARPRPNRRQFFTVGLIVPHLGLALAAPWASRVLPLAPNVHVKEHLFASWSYIRVFTQFHGWPILILVLAGIILALARRSAADVWMLTWLPPIVEFGLDGSLDRWALAAGFDPFQIMYPYGILWHATILPLAYFGALTLREAARRIAASALGERAARLRSPLCAALVLAGLTATLLNKPIVAATKDRFSFTGAYSTLDDIRAMEWLKANASPDALILNYPDYESHWTAVISERNAVYFRPQLFYIGDDAAQEMWRELAPAYLDPADPASETVIREYGVDFVLVPQIVTRPDLFPQMLRWRFPDLPEQKSSFDEAGYLDLAIDFDGARVYRVAP